MRWPLPAAAAPLLIALSIGFPSPAHAGTEEWSTFAIHPQQQDDESLIDHLLARTPSTWRDDWERLPQGLRTSQGCLTSGEWFIATDLKLRTPLPRRASFGLELTQREDDRASFTYMDFSLRVPTAWGTPGFMFRPFHDKSRQDIALFWEAGAETTAFQGRATFTLEDVFNDLWAFRQTRVGGVAQPYERHPFEPALWLVLRGSEGRIELAGQYLSPSQRRLPPDPVTGFVPRATLWGTHARGAAEVRALGCWLRAAAENRQAHSAETDSVSGLFGGDYRRQWSSEISASRALARGLELEARWLYQEGDQRSDPPNPARVIDIVDRVVGIESRYSLSASWMLRLGGQYDRITSGSSGAYFSTYGSRVESRAYLGVVARFGRLSISAVEGIELDPEPYEVWWAHDKAFLHLQTAF